MAAKVLTAGAIYFTSGTNENVLQSESRGAVIAGTRMGNRVMRRRTTTLAILLVLFLAASSTSEARLKSRPTPAAETQDTANLYMDNCQMCHGPLGKALIPEMAFVGRKWKHGTSSSDMAKIIAEGVKGTPMLPYESKLTAAQIQALARHVRAFDKRLRPEK
jgi:mono/diheme cytochrome c family protein